MKEYKFSEAEKKYMHQVLTRIREAKNDRDMAHGEFGGRTLGEVARSNEVAANTLVRTTIETGKELSVSTGTLEEKLKIVVAEMMRPNYTPELRAYDERAEPMEDLAMAYEDVLLTLRRQIPENGDYTLALSRIVELLKQGTVFVDTLWDEERRNVTRRKGDKWERERKLVRSGLYYPVINQLNVVLGNIRVNEMRRQPFVAFFDHISYAEAEALYGHLPNFKHVPATGGTKLLGDVWEAGVTVTAPERNRIERVIYQDKWEDRYNIYVSGVPMFDLEYPLSDVSGDGEYTLVKEKFWEIKHNFSYGKSFVASGSAEELSKVLDEFLRLAILKNRKSIRPPYANNTGRVLSPKVLDPGMMTANIQATGLVKLGDEGQGVTAGELGMIERLRHTINESTVSDTFSGQQSRAGTTATEIATLTERARAAMTNVENAVKSLEYKLAERSLPLITRHWFSPISAHEVEQDDALKLVFEYNRLTRHAEVKGEGWGVHQIEVVDELPTPESVLAEERALAVQYSKPVKKVYINPDALRAVRLTFDIDIVAKPDRSRAQDRLDFRESVQEQMLLAQLGVRPNVQALTSEYARIRRLPRAELFDDAPVEEEGGQMMNQNTASALAAAQGRAGLDSNNPQSLPMV